MEKQEIERFDLAQGRYYSNPYLGGNLSPSVTTILWNATLDGFDEWGAKAAAEYVWRNRKAYTRLDAIVADAMEEPNRRLNFHADIGSRFHHLVQFPEDEEDEVKEVQRSLNAWGDFLEETEAEILQHEVMMAARIEEEDDIGFGGTMDCLARIPHVGLVLLELKTSRLIHDTHAFQAAAYGHAWEFMGGEPLNEVWVVKLGKYDGVYEYETVNREKAFRAFRAAHTLFEIRGSEYLWPDRMGL